ncbi:MAG: elongation factor G [Defluviitaleaceae bacterium]|nr:elongation factor G [Defluviitaleaceae bacterium]
MKVYSANEIRNVAVLGHSGCGKTTLVEAALSVAGVTSRMGRVEDGNTASDYDPEEIRRGVSINMSVIPVEWRDRKINFVDTPGYFDFAGDVKQALAAVDAVLIMVSAKAGVEVGAELAWEYAQEMKLPCFLFVNGMDDEHADFEKVLSQMQSMFGHGIVPVMVPFYENGKCVGYVDTLIKSGFCYDAQPRDISPEVMEEAEQAFASLVEAVAETDEELMEQFFSNETLTVEEVRKGVREGIKAKILTPVLCGAALNKKEGIKPLLDMLDRYLPPASEMRTTMEVEGSDGSSVTINCNDDETLAAFVFKTIADPYVGRLSLFRVFSGVVTRDVALYNSNRDITEKAGHLYVMRGKDQIEVSEVRAGDIGAIAKLADTATQDTLCLKSKPVKVNSIDFPKSLLTLAIVPKGKGDEDKISGAFSKLMEEDKTIKFEINKETKQAVVSGVGDNQLDVLVNRLKSRYKIDIDLVAPTIPYREMIKSKASVRGKHKKQSGGRGQFGDVQIEFEPSGDLSTAYIFEEKIFGGSVPKAYFPAVEKGLQECVLAGPLAAYPVVGLKAILVDGSYHDVDSSELAFKLATNIAFKEGFMKAKPILLEPIVKIEVTVPDDYTGDIMGDMSKRRGKIMGTEKVGNKQVISAEAPMAEVQRYSTDLRSMTQGRGRFAMVFDRYEEAPGDVQAKVIAARKQELEALKDKE